MHYIPIYRSIAVLLFSILLFACDPNIDIPDYNPSTDTTKNNTGSLSVNMLKYRPHNYNMWDNWCIVKGDSIHLFHLQYTRGGVNYSKPVDLRGFGHATSGDLLRWNEKPEVLSLYDRTYDNDWNFRYTGSTVEYNGKYYTFYTMRKWGMQRIGLATSNDLYNWVIYSDNPVLEPDGRWFITFNSNGTGSNNPVWKDIVDCRDMLVIKDKNGPGFYAYFIAAAVRSDLNSPTSVVGIAYSTDLLKWEQKGIVYYPTGVSMPEMIDVFEFQGKWYMTLTTGKNNGSLSNFSDQYISRAMLYAEANSPEGPFVEDLSDNVVIGGSINSGYSMRSVEYQGKRRTMYVDVNNGPSVLALPKNVGVNDKGQLRLYYASDLLEKLRLREIESPIYAQPNNTFGSWPSHGGVWKLNNSIYTCNTDSKSWQGMIFGGSANNIELNFTVTNSTCDSYGILLSNSVSDVTLNDLAHILVIEPKKNRVYLTNYLWDFQNCRSFNFEDGRIYNFKMLLIGNTIELYINEELVFNSGLNNAGNYMPGLYANSGNIEVNNLKIYQLVE